VPTANPDPYPPELDSYLHSSAVTSKIGSQSTWVSGNDNVYAQFGATGDWMRSSLSDLEMVINSGVRTVIYDGDADYICNYMGVEAMVRSSCFFLPRPPSTPFNLSHDPVDACAEFLLEHEIFGTVRATELRDLQRPRQACWSV
jgi:hypothetical protein